MGNMKGPMGIDSAGKAPVGRGPVGAVPAAGGMGMDGMRVGWGDPGGAGFSDALLGSLTALGPSAVIMPCIVERVV